MLAATNGPIAMSGLVSCPSLTASALLLGEAACTEFDPGMAIVWPIAVYSVAGNICGDLAGGAASVGGGGGPLAFRLNTVVCRQIFGNDLGIGRTDRCAEGVDHLR